MSLSKITRNFQVTVPPDVRELKNLHIGDKVLFAIEGAQVHIIKADMNVVREAAGLWKGLGMDGVEYQKRVRKGWLKRTK